MKRTTRKTRAGRDREVKARQESSEPPRSYTHTFTAVLAAGIILRILVFATVGYFNNDNHLAVLEFVSRNWASPTAAQFNQGYHPPLYYFLAAPFFRLGSLPAVQGLSLLLSIATLVVVASLLRSLPWVSAWLKPWCLALAALHPQFILFSLFVSNDTLAIFLGAAIFYQSWRLLHAPSPINVTLLGIFLGLGLLTKAVFLVFVAPLALLVVFAMHRFAYRHLATFLALALLLGSYKYIESFVLFGNPAVSNLDFGDWTAAQKPTWIGAISLFDVNLLKLVREPVASPLTVHSYPLMLYGSFWYAFIPESTFRGNLVAPLSYLGSLIYLAALWPTVLMIVGARRIVSAVISAKGDLLKQPFQASRVRPIFEATLLFILFSNLFLIVAVGWHYDVWSVFQGRLVFPAYFGVLLTLHAGMEWTQPSRLKTRLTLLSLSILFLVFLAYFTVEFWLTAAYPPNPLSVDHMPYTIDMRQ